MAQCIKLQRKKTQLCIGSMDRKIDIYTRSLTAPSNPTGSLVDYGETFTLVARVWAMIDTPKGQTIFDEIGTEKIISDIFSIRYRDGITSENWIVYNNNRYDIVTVENYEQNKLALRLSCIIRGSADKEASKA